MNVPVIIVDRRDDLLASYSFVLPAFCRQCGERHISLFARGQEVKPFQAGDRCPQCESDGRLAYGTMLEACQQIRDREREFWFDDPVAGFVRCQFAHCGVDLVTPREYGAAPPQAPATASGTGGARIYDCP